MTTKDDALKLALEALEEFGDHYDHCPQYPTYAEPEYHPPCNCGYESAITAIREALVEHPAQPKSETTLNLKPTPISGWGQQSIGLAIPEQPAQQQTGERIDALRTLDYCHGLKAGWNFCAAGDDAGFERAMAGTSEAVRILKSKPAQQQEPNESDKFA